MRFRLKLPPESLFFACRLDHRQHRESGRDRCNSPFSARPISLRTGYSMSHVWMPLYVAKYLGKTGHLSTLEHGAYMLLIMHYWLNGPLPDDDNSLAQICRCRPEHWRKIRPKLALFFHVELGQLWRHKTIEEELQKAAELREKKSRAGIASANARSTGVQQVLQQDAQHKGNQPQPPIQKEERRSSFTSVVGGKNGSGNVTIKDPFERLARFQKTIAENVEHGWLTVTTASNPDDPQFEPALALCKATARRLNKGWPLQWPKSNGAVRAPVEP